MKSKLYIFFYFVVLSMILSLFQNCGGSFDLASGSFFNPTTNLFDDTDNQRNDNDDDDDEIVDPTPDFEPGTDPKPIPYGDDVTGNGRLQQPVEDREGDPGPYPGPNIPDNADYAIVYTSSPRQTGYPGFDLNQNVSDVAEINGGNAGFEESDLEIKKPNGDIIVIRKCTTNPNEVCAAMEGRVSPDGTKIVYSVGFQTTNLQHSTTFPTGHRMIKSLDYAHLYIYDIAKGTSTKIPNQLPNHYYRMPDWINNNEIVYSSSADNKWPVKDQWNCHQGTYSNGSPRKYQPNYHCTSQSFSTSRHGRAMQIFRMKIDGTGQTNLTPHEFMAIRPTVLKHPNNKGRIVFSSWQSAEDKAYYQGSPGPGTTTNLWWLMSIDQNGGSQTSLIGAHHSPAYINKNLSTNVNGMRVDELRAVRSVGEDIYGRLYFTNYYRRNHFGLGNPYRFTVQDFNIEGCSSKNCYDDRTLNSANPGSGQYLPEDLFSVGPFGVGADNEQNKDSLGRAMGKLGYMGRLSNGNMLATYGQGWCYNQLPVDKRNANFLGDQPVCDRQIVELLVDRVNDPFDSRQMKLIAANPLKHEWDAQEIPNFDNTVPPQTPKLTGNECFLEVVDMRKAELTPPNRAHHHLTGLAHQVGIQGNAVKAKDPSFHPQAIRSLALYGIELWDTSYEGSRFKNFISYHGFKDKWFMGKTDMQSDGSVRMKVPCDKPFQMSGLDQYGTVIAHDTTVHSLRKGETRTCYGCHEGHSVEVRSTYTKTPQELFETTLSANLNPPITDAKLKVSFNEVANIVNNRCNSCHTGFQKDSLLWSRLAADKDQIDWPWFQRIKNGNGNYLLPRPYFSPMVARHPRWSPLYWGCMNQRMDGYTNNETDEDYDFNEPTGGHKSGATAAECKKIAEWIQLGAPNE